MAGTELLIRAFGGRTAKRRQPLVQQDDDPGWWRIDVGQMNEDKYRARSGGETRLLRIAASLLGGPPVDVSCNLAGLDCQHIRLVLAAWPTRAAAMSTMDGQRPIRMTVRGSW